MHQPGEVNEARRKLAGDLVVGNVEDPEHFQIADIGRNSAGDLVADKVEDSEGREGGEALRDLAGDALPVGENEGGEAVEVANLGRDGAAHEPGLARFGEYRVLRLAAEVNVYDSASFRVAADAVPVDAAVGSGPCVEEAQVGFGE